MQRRGQRTWVQHTPLPSRFEKCHAIEPTNLICNSKLPIEANKIGTAAEKNVLAVIDHLACAGMLIRRCASTDIRASL